jgi:hypothetical protein
MADPNKKIEGDIDRFDDVFHQYGDDTDEINDANIDFDQFFTSFHKDDETITSEGIDYEAFFDDFDKKDDTAENPNIENIDYSALFTDFYSNDDKKDKIGGNVTIDLTTTEEQQLSQKLSQLSSADKQQIDVENKSKESLARTTTDKKRPILTPSTPISAVTTKKLKTDIVELAPSATGTSGTGISSGSGRGADYMPKYLSNSSQTFEDIVNPIFQKTANPFNIEDLRQIALLEHKLKLIDLNTLLWTTYLRSGTGKLNEDEQPHLQAAATAIAAAGITTTSVRYSPAIWPQELKTTMLADRTAKFKSNEIDHEKYLNYVMKMLRTLREQNTVYQMQLKERKQRLNTSFTLELEEAIKSFIEEYGIRSHRILIEGKIAIIKYDYNDKLFEADFYHETPYQEQITTFKNLYELKLDKEKSSMEVKLLKQRVAHNQLSGLFDSMQIPLPSTLNTIEDQRSRQSLICRYEQLVQRAKSDMTTIHVRTAELKSEETTKKFESTFKEYNNNQRMHDITTKLTKTMAYIMEQRFKNIEERLETLYKLKLRFFVKAPTVVKN